MKLSKSKKSYATKPRGRPRNSTRKVARYTTHKDGYLQLSRKCKEIFITGSQAVAGNFVVSDPNSLSCLVTTTSEPITSLPNHYNIPFAMKFGLSQILNYNDVTALADQYRLKKTVIRIYYNSNSSQVSNSIMLPQITYHTDADDASVPTTDSLREKMNCKIKYFNSKNYVKITVFPKVAPLLFGNGVSTQSFGISKPIWINSSYPSTEHYSLKGVLQNVYIPGIVNTNSTFKWDVTHFIEAKDFQ